MVTSRAILVALLLLTTSAFVRAGGEWGKPNGLFERLGGTYAIAAVVDDFVDRLWADPIVSANPAVAQSRARISKAGLKFQVTALLCQITGGPEKYAGRDMKQAHARLNISEREWGAMAGDFKAALDRFRVGPQEQDELFALVGSVKNDIVTGAPSAVAPAAVPAGTPAAH